ncbi:hypothetical protein F5887DRAFT_1174383, partial [Amanita rubescens]
MNMMLLATAWSATLLPLLFALFFFSTKALRRKPVFIFNVISILLGIGLGVMDIYYLYRICFHPPNAIVNDFPITATVALGMSPLLVESVLLCRLLAVYPYHSTPKRTFIAIFLPLLFLKVGRFANMCIFIDKFAVVIKNSEVPLDIAQLGWEIKNAKVEWILQL